MNIFPCFIFSKRHPLYICMSKVIHQCPGAEQTMSMTGFDLAAMERAVGMLCDDITGNFLTM